MSAADASSKNICPTNTKTLAKQFRKNDGKTTLITLQSTIYVEIVTTNQRKLVRELINNKVTKAIKVV